MNLAVVLLLLYTAPLVFTNDGNNFEESSTSNDHRQSSTLLQNADRLQKQKWWECEGPWRLPKNIIPTNYDVTLRIDPDSSVFNGSVTIDLRCLSEAKKITFHAKNLTFSKNSISVRKQSQVGVDIPISNVTYDEEHEMVHLELGSSLNKGAYVLNIELFSGTIQNDAIGLFVRSLELQQATSPTRGSTVIASQMQHAFARMVFPCFDEPNMKATFVIQIERPLQYKSFSNMPLKESFIQSPGRVLDTFEKSVVMPTYAVVFLVGIFSKYPVDEAMAQDNRTHILVPDGDLDKVAFAYQLAVKALSKLELYTKIPYPVKKIDHAVIPDFEPEAMENWGLILYQKEYIVDEWKTSTLWRGGGISLIPHELAHQWFGNMVTAEWWSYLWLNEAFATYFQIYTTNEILPPWQLWNSFIVYHLQDTLISDASAQNPKTAMTSRRCTVSDFDAVFDEITYQKGASVLRMFESIFGADEFQGGLRLYLQRRLLQNTRPSDFFQVFEEITPHLNKSPLPTNVTFTDVAVAWTEQAGFPVVTVTRDYNSSRVFIKQERFFEQRAKNLSVENQNNRWWIPLTWNTPSSPSPSTPKRPQDWLYKDKTIQVYASPNHWLLFNLDVAGFYRVNYDNQNWDLLRQQLERSPQVFPVPNRIQLINDAFSLGFAHRLNLGTALNMTRYLRNEENHYAWISAGKQFDILHDFFASSPDHFKLETYLQKLIRTTYRQLRLDIITDGLYTHTSKILQSQVASTACLYGLDICLIDARFALVQFLAETRLKGERSALANLHPDIQFAVLCGGVRSGGRSIFEDVHNLATNTSSDTDKRLKPYYRKALCCTHDLNLLTWHLADIFDNTRLSWKDASTAVEEVIKNQRSLYTGYQFVKNNVNKINNFYNSSTKHAESLVKLIINQTQTNTLYKEVRQWIVSSTGDELGNKTELLRHLDSREPEIEWSSESLQQISDWLNTPQTVLPEPMVVSEGRISAKLSFSPIVVSLVVYLWAT